MESENKIHPFYTNLQGLKEKINHHLSIINYDKELAQNSIHQLPKKLAFYNHQYFGIECRSLRFPFDIHPLAG